MALPHDVEIVASVFFALALIHTFATSRLQHLARRFPEGSVGENVFHLLGEVEIVFGLWAGILILTMAFMMGPEPAIAYAESLSFGEALFVFVVMVAAATRPVLNLASAIILYPARGSERLAYVSCLVIGPLLGSFITEPAAMTVTALLVRDRFFTSGRSAVFRYVTLAVLLVNVSIGGLLTPFAAPPVLLAARAWDWDMRFMVTHFGWKAAIACILNAIAAAAFLRNELGKAGSRPAPSAVPSWLTAIHVVFLVLIVAMAHHPVLFMGLFMFFLGVTWVTAEYQDELKLRESLLVGLFLGGLVVLGRPQHWWLESAIRHLEDLQLFLGATFLTAFTDNAALTFLGSQVQGVSESYKYALVAGAVAGGGLTVIANAPNPAAFSILQDRFGPDRISALHLAAAAIVPTLVAMACLWLL